MPSLDVIRNLTLRASTNGFPEATAAANNLATAQGRVATSAGTMATVTDMSSRRTLSAAAALERLAAKHDDTYRAQQQHARGTALLERATAQGLAGTREFAIAQEALNKLHHGAGDAVGFNRMQMMEATHVAKAFFDEIAAGQSPLRALQVEGGRIAQIFAEGQGGVGGTFKSLAGLAARAATGWVGLGVATAGAAAIGVTSILAYENAQNRLATALEGTGRAAGLTVAQLSAVAEAGSRAGGISASQGRSLAAGFAHEGFGADLTQGLVGSAKRYGEITGTDTAEAGRALVEAFKDPERGLGDLNKAFGFLDARLQTTVDRLTAQGNVEEARMVALDALKAAEASVTDHSWGLSKALAGAESSLSDWASKLGHSIATSFGFVSDADKLKTDRTTLANLQKVDPLGNADYIRELQTEIAGLERGQDAEVQKAAVEADKARAREQSLLLDRAVRSALPDIDRERTLSDRATMLGRGLNTPGMAADLGVTGGQLRQAYENTATQLANLDPFKRMVQDAKLATDGIEAYTLAEHAAVDARRAELQVLREDGDLRRAALAGRIAENEAIAKANNAASDRLDQARQDRALVGLSPYERGLQEIKNQYEGVGGFFSKEGTTRHELSDAMKPVNDDLRSAGESVVTELRRIAQSMATVQAPGASPFGTLDHSAFTGGTGAYAQPMFALMQRAIAAGATPAAAAGFAAGTSMESGTRLDPTSDNGSHLGVAQWDSARWRALVSKLGGGAMSTQAGQFNGIFAELGSNEAGAGRKLLAGQSVADGIGASDAYERPGDVEAARRRGEAQSRGNALLAAYQGGKALPTIDIVGKPLTVGGGASVAAPPLLASTAMADNRASLGEKVAGYNQEQIEGPLKAANTALSARISLLGAERAAVGQSASAVQAAAEAQKLLSQYEAQDPNHKLGAAAWQSITAGVDAYRAKLTSAMEAEDAFRRQQQQIVGAMDDFRDASKGALSSFVGDMLNGKSATEGLRDALKSIEGKIAGKLEDTAINSLFGQSGTTGAGSPLGGGLLSMFGGANLASSGMLANLGAGFASGGYTGHGSKYQVAGVVHAGEWVVPAAAVPQNLPILHAINTTGRVPGFADGGMVGGMPVNSGSGGGMSMGGDTYHIDARGSALTHAEMTSALTAAIAANNRALPGMLRDRQMRGN